MTKTPVTVILLFTILILLWVFSGLLYKKTKELESAIEYIMDHKKDKPAANATFNVIFFENAETPYNQDDLNALDIFNQFPASNYVEYGDRIMERKGDTITVKKIKHK